MFRNLFLFFFMAFNLLNYSYAITNNSTNENFSSTLKKVAPAVSSAGTIDYKAGCSSCAQAAANERSATLISKDNNQKIDLTILSEDEVNNTFTEIAARDDIPFAYPMDGCYARAHKIVRILEDKGIIAGKAFLEGELFIDTKYGEVGWGYHVAPVVLVKKGNAILPYVIDPSLFSKAVPYEEWKAKITSKSKSKLAREYFTNRFAYDPGDRVLSLKAYEDENIDDMESTNRNFTRVLAMYNTTKGKK